MLFEKVRQYLVRDHEGGTMLKLRVEPSVAELLTLLNRAALSASGRTARPARARPVPASIDGDENANVEDEYVVSSSATARRREPLWNCKVM